MKPSLSVSSVVAVIALTLGASAFHVSVDQDHQRDRLRTARSSCVASGGQWVKVDGVHECHLPSTGN